MNLQGNTSSPSAGAGTDPRELTRGLIDHARAAGADLVGIAPIERFAGVEPRHHPASIFPEVRTVVVIGKRITRGALRGLEEGTQFDLYQKYGYEWLENRVLSMCTFKTAEFLEDRRWEAVPILDLPVEIPPLGIPIREGLPAPNVLVDLPQAAVRAGLGEIGYLDVFLSPQYGPRQRFQAILTDAELAPLPVFGGTICDRSRELAGLCPLGAIDPDDERVLEICGKRMTVAGIRWERCAACANGAFPNRHHAAGRPDRLGALCVRSYLDYLERHDRLGNRFRSPFRDRQPWVAPTWGSSRETGAEIE